MSERVKPIGIIMKPAPKPNRVMIPAPSAGPATRIEFQTMDVNATALVIAAISIKRGRKAFCAGEATAAKIPARIAHASNSLTPATSRATTTHNIHEITAVNPAVQISMFLVSYRSANTPEGRLNKIVGIELAIGSAATQTGLRFR